LCEPPCFPEENATAHAGAEALPPLCVMAVAILINLAESKTYLLS